MRLLPLLLAAVTSSAVAADPTVLVRTGTTFDGVVPQDVAPFTVDDAGSWRVKVDHASGHGLAGPSGLTWQTGWAAPPPSTDTLDEVLFVAKPETFGPALVTTLAPSGDRALLIARYTPGVSIALREGDPLTGVGVPPNATLRAILSMTTNRRGIPRLVIEDDQGRRALMQDYREPGGTDLLYAQAYEGEPLYGEPGRGPIQHIAADPHLLDLHDHADMSWVVRFSATPGQDECLAREGDVLACTGDPSPLPGATYASFEVDGALAVTQGPHLLVRSQVTSATGTTTLLALDDTVVAQVGTHQPGTPPGTVLQSLGTGPVDLGANGTTAFWGSWDGSDPTASAGIFVDGALYLVDGQALPGVGTVAHWRQDVVLSEGGVYLLVTADLTDGTAVALRYDLSDRFRLVTPPTLVAGDVNHLHVDHAAVGHRIALMGGSSPGATPMTGPCAGLVVGLGHARMLDVDRAYYVGLGGAWAFWHPRVPAAAAGRTAYVQAVDLDACVATEVLALPVQ
ncbi:MAG: hypothetical protein H6733_17150 [Alphaproteobacteria bacterium]|nr:hypothetical protein [Alphaproteobacteria bacterium]